jgi:hypothetical protein
MIDLKSLMLQPVLLHNLCCKWPYSDLAVMNKSTEKDILYVVCFIE